MFVIFLAKKEIDLSTYNTPFRASIPAIFYVYVANLVEIDRSIFLSSAACKQTLSKERFF